MSMPSVAAERRDKDTASKIAGVYVSPLHWAARQVHAFRTWTGERTLVTWCGLAVDLSAEARQTADLISCLSCGQASWDALKGRLAPSQSEVAS
jgi:hypothetical protein